MKRRNQKQTRGYVVLGVVSIIAIIIIGLFITSLQNKSYETYGNDGTNNIRKEVLHRYNIDEDFTDNISKLNNSLLNDFGFEVKDEYLLDVNTIQNLHSNVVAIDIMIDGDYYDFEFVKIDDKLKVNYAVKNGIENNEEFVTEFFNIQ